VSPVVATLILILIAVAAAAALYLWLVGWQGGVTKSIGTPSIPSNLQFSIGGSTSVYPFDQLAVTQFLQNNTNAAISNNQGGTGAGMTALCAGKIDVGAASSPQNFTTLTTNYGCSTSDTGITVTVVAYDAVDVVVATTNTHGLQSINYDTLLSIYVAAGGGLGSLSGTMPNGGSAAQTISATNGYVFNDASGGSLAATPATPTPGASGFTWNQIPACAAGVATCAGVAGYAQTTAIGAGVPTVVGNDISYTAAASPCGWTVCAGGANNLIQPWERSDTSGTEQTFTARILGVGDSAGTFAGIGFSGCGSDGQLASCGISEAHQGNGNPAVITGVHGSADAIGFASDGLARAGGSGVSIVGFEGVGQASNGPVTPTVGSSGTIAKGIASPTSVAGYAGWRPFSLITLTPPTPGGIIEQFLTFVLDPANNQNLATESQEISIYSV
jgi:ABC-type phosphate transport system substrate-binding protein